MGVYLVKSLKVHLFSGVFGIGFECGPSPKLRKQLIPTRPNERYQKGFLATRSLF